MRKLSIWKHAKYPSRKYRGHYGQLAGERVFILSTKTKSGRDHNIAFESYQLAQAVGWKKCKR